MKKLLLLSMLFASFFLNAQQQESTHTLTTGTPAVSPAFSNDVIITNSSTIDQRHVRISVAFNGWLYAAYNTYDSLTNSGGITIRTSRDNGQTWSTIDSYSVPNIRYPALDIVVAGTDTTNLRLYLAGVNHNVTGGTYVMFVDRYNATTGVFVGSNYNLQNGTRPVYDVSLASDYMFPATVASPYSVGLLYSTYSSSYDSIVFLGALDGGNTWSVRRPVAITGGYHRGVSLAYGRSASASNGRYFAAWEQIGSSGARTGHIFTSHSLSTADGTWMAKVNLDSISSTMINLCSHPQIAVQYNNMDNDSGACTAVVLVDRDYYGDGSEYDLLGFENKVAHSTNNWYRLDIDNSSTNAMQPDVSFDPVNNNFLATYYDSTNGKLPYVSNGMNLTTPSVWASVSAQYNDISTNLKVPFPRVEPNPSAIGRAALAWNAEGVLGRGVSMFDAEYVVSGINAQTAGHGFYMNDPYPVPAADQVTIGYALDHAAGVTISVYNALGEKVLDQNEGTQTDGLHNSTINVQSLSDGVYFCRISSGRQMITKRIVVQH
jgi:hypothetical protein